MKDSIGALELGTSTSNSIIEAAVLVWLFFGTETAEFVMDAIPYKGTTASSWRGREIVVKLWDVLAPARGDSGREVEYA